MSLHTWRYLIIGNQRFMKLTRTSNIRVNLSCDIFLKHLFPRRLLNGVLISRDLNFHYFVYTSRHSWHLREGSILSGWRSASDRETMKNLRSGQQISSHDPLRTFRESTTKKAFISQIICLTLFLLCQQVLFLWERRVNFLHFELLPSFSR